MNDKRPPVVDALNALGTPREVLHNMASIGFNRSEIAEFVSTIIGFTVTAEQVGTVFAIELEQGEALLRACPERMCSALLVRRRALAGDREAMIELMLYEWEPGLHGAAPN